MEQPVSFVIRVINYGADRPMHGQIEHVPTGTTAHFSSFDQAHAFIRSYLQPEAVPHILPPEAARIPSLTPGSQPQISSILSFRRGRQALTGAEPTLLPPVGELPVIEVVPPLVSEAVAAEPAATSETPRLTGSAEPDATPPVGSAALILPAGVSSGSSASAPGMAFGSSEMSVAETMTIPIDRAVTALLNILGSADYLPPASPPLPAASVSIASLAEQAVGLGNFRGLETRGAFTVAALKGIQLNALARYQLWASTPVQMEQAATELHARLLADRPRLLNIDLPDGATGSLLRLTLETSALADYLDNLDGWRKQVDYRVLFEYRYQDSDAAESLIARIPIHADQEILESPVRETTVVSDDMIRWDDQAAPPLVIRGRSHIGSLTMLVFLPDTAPTGGVTLTRTFDGASTPPVFTTLADFLDAVTGPAAERNAQMVFASFDAFIAAFGAAGADVGLGDWNTDDAADQYQSRRLSFAAPIVLPGASDRFEITYDSGAFDRVGVLYLRAQRGA